ncbi:hypothetical protein ACJW30_09G041500 [Castanea mollissima]
MDMKDDYDRLGPKALYAFIYPNFMINRYGPWMDTNLVLPLGPRRCPVVFDYFLEASLKVSERHVPSKHALVTERGYRFCMNSKSYIDTQKGKRKRKRNLLRSKLLTCTCMC